MDRADYIASGVHSVHGWFTTKDANLFSAIDDAQRKTGITGDLLEIGCYEGASAILLGYMRNGDERVVVNDVFDGDVPSADDLDERERYYHKNFSRQTFEGNYRRFHGVLPEVIAGPSTSIGTIGRRFRFIHIDGSHTYDIVRADLLLAKELLIPGGLVVFDDLLSPHTPGVTAAVWQGVANDGLIPLFQTVKFYGTWDSPIEVEWPNGLSAVPHTFGGHTMYHVEG